MRVQPGNAGTKLMQTCQWHLHEECKKTTLTRAAQSIHDLKAECHHRHRYSMTAATMIVDTTSTLWEQGKWNWSNPFKINDDAWECVCVHLEMGRFGQDQCRFSGKSLATSRTRELEFCENYRRVVLNWQSEKINIQISVQLCQFNDKYFGIFLVFLSIFCTNSEKISKLFFVPICLGFDWKCPNPQWVPV